MNAQIDDLPIRKANNEKGRKKQKIKNRMRRVSYYDEPEDEYGDDFESFEKIGGRK